VGPAGTRGGCGAAGSTGRAAGSTGRAARTTGRAAGSTGRAAHATGRAARERSLARLPGTASKPRHAASGAHAPDSALTTRDLPARASLRVDSPRATKSSLSRRTRTPSVGTPRHVHRDSLDASWQPQDRRKKGPPVAGRQKGGSSHVNTPIGRQ
jgi:hypothetical protein